MPEHVLLAWSRRHALDENNDHLNDGYISVEKKGKIVSKEPFAGVPYHKMITQLSAETRAHKSAKVFLLRLEAQPALASEVSPEMTKLLREDPVQYIRATSQAPPTMLRRSVMSDVKPKSDVKITVQPLRAGYDTLADAFCEHVYLSIRMPGEGVFEVECPTCSNWTGFAMKAETGKFLIRCTEGCHNLKAHSDWVQVEELVPMTRAQNPRWAVVSLETLLKRDDPRFFIPRAWNPSGAWITYGDLKTRYEAFKKEKEACTDNDKDSAPSA